MTTASDAIADFIADYYYGEVTRETVLKDADAFLEAMENFPEPIRLELAALLNPWRPIETAPKDDVMSVWLWARGYSMCVAMRARRMPHGVWRRVDDRRFVSFEPTYWLPLPAPPSEDKT